MFSHFDKHLLHVGKSQRFFLRSLQLPERVKLLRCDDVTLDLICLVEVSDRIFDEGMRDGGREFEGFGITTSGRTSPLRHKSVCHCERSKLVCFESDLLSQHDIAGHQIAVWYETVAHYRTADFVEFFYVRHVRVVDAIPLGCVAADDIEKVTCIKLRQLLG